MQLLRRLVWHSDGTFLAHLLVCACAVLSISPAASLAEAAKASTELPTELRAALDANARAIGPLTVEWERTRRSPLAPSQWTETVKSWIPQVQILAPQQVTLACEGNKFYFYKAQLEVPLDPVSGKMLLNKPLKKWTFERSFDGKLMFLGTGKKPPNGDATLGINDIDTLRKARPDYRYLEPEYFYEAGFKLPEVVREFGPPPQSLILYLLDNRGSLVRVDRERVDTADCLSVEVAWENSIRLTSVKGVEFVRDNRKYTFHLDPALGYAVRQHEEKSESGDLLERSVCSEFQRVGNGGLWLPRRCEVTEYWGRAFWEPKKVFRNPILVSTYRVTRMDDKPVPSELFTLVYTAPGTSICDGRLPGSWQGGRGEVCYTIPADPSMLDEVIERAIKGKAYVPRSRFSTYGVWFISLNAAIVVFLVLYYVRRRYAASR